MDGGERNPIFFQLVVGFWEAGSFKKPAEPQEGKCPARDTEAGASSKESNLPAGSPGSRRTMRGGKWGPRSWEKGENEARKEA